MHESLLYLAGPITGISYGASTDWRQYVMQNLPSHIIGVSPMRAKHYLSHENKIADHYPDHALSSQEAITSRDRFDVTRSAAILVNLLGAEKVSIGSVMEIAWADLMRHPIILVMEKSGNIHDHAMIRAVVGHRVYSLDEAIIIASAILSPI